MRARRRGERWPCNGGVAPSVSFDDSSPYRGSTGASARRRASHTLQMRLDIHALMQDADDIDHVALQRAIEQKV